MKKTCYMTIVAILLSTGCAFADGNAFTPLNFDDTAYSVPNTNTASNTKTINAVNTPTETNSGIVNSSNVSIGNGTGNVDLQNAIAKVDTALDAIKAEQNICKSKYADVDNQYKFIKNERSNLKKQVRANEKRIKELSKAKTKLSNNVI